MRIGTDFAITTAASPDLAHQSFVGLEQGLWRAVRLRLASRTQLMVQHVHRKRFQRMSATVRIQQIIGDHGVESGTFQYPRLGGEKQAGRV